MSPSENAFNAIYPTVLKLVALNRRTHSKEIFENDDMAENLSHEIMAAMEELTMRVEGIEAGEINDCLTTSISGVLNQMRRRATHN